jgi:hypothetical protein
MYIRRRLQGLHICDTRSMDVSDAAPSKTASKAMVSQAMRFGWCCIRLPNLKGGREPEPLRRGRELLKTGETESDRRALSRIQ